MQKMKLLALIGSGTAILTGTFTLQVTLAVYIVVTSLPLDSTSFILCWIHLTLFGSHHITGRSWKGVMVAISHYFIISLYIS